MKFIKFRQWLARKLIGKQSFISGFLITGGEKPSVIYYPPIDSKITARQAASLANLVPLMNIDDRARGDIL